MINANITEPEEHSLVNVCSFMFIAVTKEMRLGFLNSLPERSPLRLPINDDYLKPGTEPDSDWESYGKAKEETKYSVLDTVSDDGSFVPQNVDKRPLKSSVKEINHETRREDKEGTVGKVTRLLSRNKKENNIKSYGALREHESSEDGKRKKTKRKVITSQPQSTSVLCDLASSATSNIKELLSNECFCTINY